MLVDCIKSIASAGVSHLVAVDGAYALYPDGAAASHPNQHAAITLACRQLGIGCTLHVPTEPWAGNEVEKRNALFALGWGVARDGDWFMVQDADMAVTKWPADLVERLAETDRVAAEVQILDVVAQRAQQLDWPPLFPFRAFYKAQPITVGPRHSIYRDAEGVSLWNGNGVDDRLPVLDLTDDVLIEHRPDRRTTDRQLGKLRYYAERDALGTERGECEWCGAKGDRLVAVRWRWSDEMGCPVANWREGCAVHAAEAEKVGSAELRMLGVDPDAVRVENRMGRVPAGIAVRG